MHIGRRWTRRSAVAPGIVKPDTAGPARTPVRRPRTAPGLLPSLLDDSDAGGAVLGGDLRVREANHAFARMAGQQTPEGVVGLASEDLPPLAAAEIQELLRSVLADGRTRRFHVRTGPPGPAGATGRTGDAGNTGATGTCHRLTERGRALGLGVVLVADAPADMLTGAAATGAAAGTATDPAADLRHARRRITLLDAATAEVGTTLDMDTTCAELARFAVPRLSELATVDVLPITEPGSGAAGPSASGLSAAGRLHRAGLARVPALGGPTAALANPGEPVRHRAGSAAARSLAERRPVPADLGAAAADSSPWSPRGGRTAAPATAAPAASGAGPDVPTPRARSASGPGSAPCSPFRWWPGTNRSAC
ncbi:PAS domain-containing protein [Kitasatospora paranensis]|uniref:PAS domain-containing protein n=1 Tax=Kitasatospora paranensis TaxID=258053 RepID=UPI0031F138BB